MVFYDYQNDTGAFDKINIHFCSDRNIVIHVYPVIYHYTTLITITYNIFRYVLIKRCFEFHQTCQKIPLVS